MCSAAENKPLDKEGLKTKRNSFKNNKLNNLSAAVTLVLRFIIQILTLKLQNKDTQRGWFTCESHFIMFRVAFWTSRGEK